MKSYLSDPRLFRIIFAAVALGSMFLPWITLDGHDSSRSGVGLMVYAFTGDDRSVMWNINMLAGAAVLVMPFLITLFSQMAVWNDGSIPRRLILTILSVGSIAAFIYLTGPVRDSLGIGLFLLIISIIIATSSILMQIMGIGEKSRTRSRIHPRVKQALFSEFGGKCALCDDEHVIGNLEVDHIVPWSKGGPDTYENYQLLCGRCNRLKGVNTNAEARVKLEESLAR